MRNPIVRSGSALVAAALISVLLCACGGGGDDTTTTPPPAGTAVGPAGATVTSADGKATLVVPPGALGTTISISLRPATPADGYADDTQIIAGTAYKIEAPEMALATPAAFSIALPASSAATASTRGDRKHAQAIIPAAGFIACYLQVNDPTHPSNYSFVGFGPGDDVQPTPQDIFVCAFDTNVYTAGDLSNPPCPPGWGFRFNDHWEIPSYFTDSNQNTFPPGSGQGFITMCAPKADPVVNVVSLAVKTAILGPASQPVLLPSMGPMIVALFDDTTQPGVQLTSTVLPAGNGMVKVHLEATASDNVGVTKVAIVEEAIVSVNLKFLNTFADLKTTVATFTASPYIWESAPMSPDQLFADHHSYSATAYDAAGNRKTVAQAFNAATPAITSFSASPASLPAGGGDVTLSWTTPGPEFANFSDMLVIDHGVGDVTALSSTVVHVTSTTTFTLTGTNSSGTGTASLTVTVAPPPAPTIASFTATPASLPAGGGSVTLAWTTSGATTLAIDNGVGTVSGDSGSVVVDVASTTPFTLTATNLGGTATKSATVTVAAIVDRFVDVAAGSDANDCSQAAPCKTMSKAMTVASSGATVYLADGVYAPATQGNGVTIGDGVALKATHAGAASIANGLVLTVAGSSAINGIVLDVTNGTSCGSITASGVGGPPTLALTGVLIRCMGAINLAGSVSAVMTPGALANGAYTAALPGGFGSIIFLNGKARLTIQGGVIDGNGLGSPAFGGGFLAAAGSSALTLSGVTLRNRTATGISVSGTSSLVVSNNSLIDSIGIAGNCPTASAIVISGPGNVTLDHSQISNGPSGGICVRNSTSAATIQIVQGTIARMGDGIVSEIGFGSTAVVTMNGASFSNNVNGINWAGLAGTSFDISGSSFAGNVTGIFLDGAAGLLKLRNSFVSSNSGAGVALSNGVVADLGTQADAGGNTLTGNTSTGLQINLTSAGAAQAVGNTWNANVQGADNTGHYASPVQKTGPASGTNYIIGNAGFLDL
ncbi:MAG: beta strand repeat-containing protein [Caldimonas sp.]